MCASAVEVTAFRSLDTGEKAKDEGEFEQQRKAVIADIQSAKAEGKQKTFVSAPLAIPVCMCCNC